MATHLILGATSAIAEQYARLHCQQGNSLILVARNQQALAEIKQDLLVRGCGRVECLEMDFARHDKLPELVSSVTEIATELDVLLVAFGTLPDQNRCVEDINYVDEQFSLNANSVILAALSFVGIFKRQQKGCIAVISSVAGDRGRQSNYIYGSAKAALSTFLSGLRNELIAKNIHVLTIKPGFVITPMTSAFKKGVLWASPEKVAQDISRAVRRKKNILYTPWFWRWIMLIIRMIPEFVFKKLKL